MAEFIAGLFGSGIESTIAANVAALTENFEKQLRTQEAVQQGYARATQASANAVLQAGYRTADAEMAQAQQSFMTAGGDMISPLADIGHGMYRERTTEFQEMNADGANLEDLRAKLEGNEGAPQAGPASQAPARQMSDQELEAMAQKPIKDFTEDDKNALGTLKTAREQAENGENGVSRKRARLYRRMDKKLKTEEENLQNRRTRYNGTTDRRSNLITSFGRATGSFLTGGGQLLVKKAREDQAQADTIRTLADGTKDIFRSSQDAVQTGVQGTIRTYEAQIEAFGSLARANAPV